MPADELVAEVRAVLARSGAAVTPHAVAEALRAAGRPVGDTTVLAVHAALRAESVGLGPLEPLLRIPGVTDILVNGPRSVWIDRGAGLEPVSEVVADGVGFADEPAVRRFAQRLAAAGGRRLDDASPTVDVRLPDGTRCHAVLAPVARPGTLVSLRVPHRLGLSLADLADRGALSPAAVALLRRMLTARLAFLVSGGTRPLAEPLMARVRFESQMVAYDNQMGRRNRNHEHERHLRRHPRQRFERCRPRPQGRMRRPRPEQGIRDAPGRAVRDRGLHQA